MSESIDVDLKKEEDSLVLKGIAMSDDGEWHAKKLRPHVYIVEKKSDLQGSFHEPNSLGWFRQSEFTALLRGLIFQKFDGRLTVDTIDATKKLYFRGGQLVFAGSTLMDDRLGEVIYREGLISLDQLTEAAVQVDRSRKFGRILIESGAFSGSQIWNALRLQVANIFESTFLAENVYVSIAGGDEIAPSSVTLEDVTEAIVDQYASHAFMIRQFASRLEPSLGLSIDDRSLSQLAPRTGTFIGDLLGLVKDYPRVGEFFDHSKLTETNTTKALFGLVHLGIVIVSGIDTSLRNLDSVEGAKGIKSSIDAYHQILGESKKAFDSEKIEFPIVDLELFLQQRYAFGRGALFLRADGSIAAESMISILARLQSGDQEVRSMRREINDLTLFLLQTIGDGLPRGKGWALKQLLQKYI